MDQDGSRGGRGRDRRDAHDSTISHRALGRNRACDPVWEPVRNLKRPRATCEILDNPSTRVETPRGSSTVQEARWLRKPLRFGVTALETEGTSRRRAFVLCQHAKGSLVIDPFTVPDKRLQTLNGV